MSLSMACPNCGKKYRAPDHLAGQRVKCRGCGTVFALQNGADDTGDAAYSPTADVASPSPAIPTRPLATQAPTAPSQPAFARGISAPATPAPPSPDDVFSSAFSSPDAPLYIPTRGSRRVNVPIPYPGSRQLDQWLPIALPAISFLWIVLQVFVSNGSGAAWTSWIRLLVVLLAFFAIVLPIGWISVNIAAAQGKFHLPPNARLRTIAAFSLPTAIAAFLYLSLGSF
jgi:hypothetical protein